MRGVIERMLSMRTEQRMEIERKIVRHLIRTMKKHGWNAIAVDDGGDGWEQTKTETEVMGFVFGVDESSIKFHKKVGNVKVTHFAYIVLGNDGYDCICDYGYSNKDDFAEVMEKEVDPYIEKLEENSHL